MTKSHSKLDLKIDNEPLKTALKQRFDLFGEHSDRGFDSPHYEMVDIWIRYNDIRLYGSDLTGFNDEHKAVWYPAYYKLPEIKPIISDIFSAVDGGELGGVLITKLPPWGKVHPHVDGGWHADYYDKYYVPIEDHGSIFGFEDGDIMAKEGEVYKFDNSISHWVNNDTNEDRIALIVCIK